MKTLLIALVTLTLSASVFAADPTCSTLEKYEQEDLGLIESYFKEIDYKTSHTRRLEKRQIRKAVSDYYKACEGERIDGEYCYSESMTDREVDELGEGVHVQTFAAKDGTLFTGVNVGFGGGNSAQYFFRFGTLEILPFLVLDGFDCVGLKKPNR